MEGIRRSVRRHRLAPHRRLVADPAALKRWLLALGLAGVAAAVTSAVIGSATDSRARWGHTRPVVVTTSEVARGEALEGRVAVEEWPAALAPEDALASIDDLGSNARAAGPLSAGSPVTGPSTLRSGGYDPDTRRVAVPHGLAPLPLNAGDRVDVWATYDPSLAGSGLQTRRVTSGAEVVAVDDHVAVVAVEPGDAAEVAEAVALATVTLVGIQ